MEQQRTKKCVYCRYYEGYYTRKLHRYERTNKGYCKKHDKIVLNGETCERWQNNTCRRALCRRAAARELYKIMMDVINIRKKASSFPKMLFFYTHLFSSGSNADTAPPTVLSSLHKDSNTIQAQPKTAAKTYTISPGVSQTDR